MDRAARRRPLMWSPRNRRHASHAPTDVGPENRCRLAVVTDAAFPWNKGGKETRAYEILRRLATRGFEVHVYTMRWWESKEDPVLDGIRYHAIGILRPLYSGDRRSIRQAVAFSLTCFKLLRADFDVLEADAIPFLPLLPLRLVTWVKRRPMLSTFHEFWGTAYWRSYLGPLGIVAAFIERQSVRLPDRIIAASQGTAHRLAGNAKADLKIVILSCGLSVADIDATPGRTRAHDFVFVGRLLRHKNVERAILALAELNRYRAFTLLVVGDGPDKRRLEVLARELGLDKQVTFVGAIPEHRDVFGYVKSADVFVFPSLREGFGVAVLEAMACGLPVVMVNHSDNLARHLVESGKSGIVSDDETASFASAMSEAHARRVEMGMHARERAAAYDWDVALDLAVTAYSI